MEGTFDYYGGSDVYFAFFNSNTLEELDNIPVKNNGLAFDETKSNCTSGATIEWNDELWAPKILNLTNAKTKCSLYFTNALTVTFDPDGGTLDTLTKEVAYNSSYGYLPTPTKAGYTFKGWNGKNLLNYNEIKEVAYQGISVDENGNVSDTTPTSDGRGWLFEDNRGWNVNLIAGTYILSLNFSVLSTQGDNKMIISSSDNDNICATSLLNKEIVTCSFTLTKATEISIVAKGYDGVYRIQLEEGDTFTEWEPYFVTSDVKVTRNENHTLKAIWEENN